MGFGVNIMECTIVTKLANISLDMNVVKKLCKINEYKGKQIIYEKQPKKMIADITDKAILKFVYDNYSNNFISENEKLIKLITNEIKPNSRQDIDVIEFRDLVKIVNIAFEDIEISYQTILELHGYLNKYSFQKGCKYKNKKLNKFGDSLYSKFNIENKLEQLCENYHEILSKDEIPELIIIACFVIDFILIEAFEEDNLLMAKILTLLLLNKSGYEIGRFNSLGKLYCDPNYMYVKTLFNSKVDFKTDCYNINNWLEYFLGFIIIAYEDFNKDMNFMENKKETKTRRIEKVINSTLGYFTKDDVINHCPDISEATINRVFDNFRKSGKIEVVSKGRRAKWKKK